MQDFEALSARFASQTVLCIGDLMLDDFVYGDVSRISPEAPAPVIAVSRSEIVVGGAGNVARNIAALGARCIFVGMIGHDEAAHTLTSALAHEKLMEPLLVVDATRPTTRKVRFVSGAFLDAICCAPTGNSRRPPPRCRAAADCQGAVGVAARRYRRAVGLRQGRADQACHQRSDGRRAQARQAGDRRSQERGSVAV